jgi:hypothetical protein
MLQYIGALGHTVPLAAATNRYCCQPCRCVYVEATNTKRFGRCRFPEWPGAATWASPGRCDAPVLTYGPATVREIHARLAVEPPLAYTTVMTICVRLSEKGLLERQRIDRGEHSTPVGHPYRYAPAISEEAFVRTAVAARLAELQEHFPALFDTPASPRLRTNAQTDRPQIERLLAYLGGLQQSNGCGTQ